MEGTGVVRQARRGTVHHGTEGRGGLMQLSRVETSGFFIYPSKDCKVCGKNTVFWVFVVI